MPSRVSKSKLRSGPGREPPSLLTKRHFPIFFSLYLILPTDCLCPPTVAGTESWEGNRTITRWSTRTWWNSVFNPRKGMSGRSIAATLKCAKALSDNVVHATAKRMITNSARKKHSGMKLKFGSLYPIRLNLSWIVIQGRWGQWKILCQM